MKKILFFLLVLLFLTTHLMAEEQEVQELDEETVTNIWPYPEEVQKVVAAKADIKKKGQSLRLADVVTESSTTGKCMAYQTYFKKGPKGWEYHSIAKKFKVSCDTYQVEAPAPKTSTTSATKSTTTSKGNKGSSSGSSSPSADPRDHVERGLHETNRTLDDVDNVGRTIDRVQKVKSWF